MSNPVKEFNAYREKMNAQILSDNNTVIKRIFNLDTNAFKKGALDATTKELLGLVASAVLRCDDCIKYHLEKAYHLSADGRPGPVWIDIPANIQNAKIDPKEESSNSRHKIIIFAKNSQGCKSLNSIYSEAFSKAFNAVDQKILKKYWNNKNLALAVPFYDSFIFNNTMKFSSCTPSFSFTKPTFFLENNGLPFDLFLRSNVIKYAKENNFNTEDTKSIYYKNKKDVSALQTYKCITGRTFGNKTLSKPNLDHFGSNEFCFESWKENS